ncbi:MAG: sugar phosphate isomerase/epimerase [Pirellulaceae bacterium]|jgi:sugar phosphate isomerase/epimerase|nr:sugar phosphate isomerase/epimerase [Pirellulaceae bacterium]
MSKRTSIGTWAFLFNQKEPIGFEDVVHGLHRLGFDGLELGGFGIHPNPDQLATPDQRAAVRELWVSRGMGCSGLAADLWGERLITAPDNKSYLATFGKNLAFCQDLGIDVIRVDTTEDPWVLGEVPGETRPEQVTRQVAYDAALERVCHTWRQAAQQAADCGIRVVWEFEPGFAFNKPSDIQRVLDGVGHDNFYVMFDTCHADNVAVHGRRQPGQPETLPGGIRELAQRLRGKIGRLHLIDSDGTINEHKTSTHPPFGEGKLDFPEFMPAIVEAGCPDDWWTIDLCFWPNAWDATAKCKAALDDLIRTYG